MSWLSMKFITCGFLTFTGLMVMFGIASAQWRWPIADVVGPWLVGFWFLYFLALMGWLVKETSD